MSGASATVFHNRMAREMAILKSKGVMTTVVEDAAKSPSAGDPLSMHLEVVLPGPPGSPYERGMFRLEVRTFARFPFEPPQMRFVTRIYHPNVDDSSGRICLSVLKPSSWKPSMNIYSVLQCLQQLMAEPNGDDPLVPEIGREFLADRRTFEDKARARTESDARPSAPTPAVKAGEAEQPPSKRAKKCE